MQRIKNQFLPLLLMAMLFIFSACGEDNTNTKDEPDAPEQVDQENEPDAPGSQTPAYYVLLSVTERERMANGNIFNRYLFRNPVYEINGWTGAAKTVLESYERYDESVQRFIYSMPNNITYYDGAKKDMEYTLTSSDRISNVMIGRESHTFEYDSKGRLVAEIARYGSLPERQIEEYTYDDRYNMIGYKRSNDDELVKEYKIEYTSIPAKTIPLQCFDNSIADIFSPLYSDWPLLEMGLYGNTIPLYLVDRIVSVPDGGIERQFDYKLDKNGYVVEMTEMSYSSSGTVISTYNFEWKPVSVPSYTNWLFHDIGSPYYRYL